MQPCYILIILVSTLLLKNIYDIFKLVQLSENKMKNYKDNKSSCQFEVKSMYSKTVEEQNRMQPKYSEPKMTTKVSAKSNKQKGA